MNGIIGLHADKTTVEPGGIIIAGIGWWCEQLAFAGVGVYDPSANDYIRIVNSEHKEAGTYHDDLSLSIPAGAAPGDYELWGFVTNEDESETNWAEPIPITISPPVAQIVISTSTTAAKRGDRITVNAQWNYHLPHYVSICLYSGNRPYGNPADSSLKSRGSYNENFQLTVSGGIPLGAAKIKGRILAGRDTIWSNEINIDIAGPPVAPSNLSATPKSSTEIVLTWSLNSTNETGVKAESQTGSGGWIEHLLPARATGATITGLNPDTYYNFRVRAYNSTGNSDYCDTVTAKTGGPPPGVEGEVSIITKPEQAVRNQTLRYRVRWKANVKSYVSLQIFDNGDYKEEKSTSPRPSGGPYEENIDITLTDDHAFGSSRVKAVLFEDVTRGSDKVIKTTETTLIVKAGAPPPGAPPPGKWQWPEWPFPRILPHLFGFPWEKEK